MFTLFAFIALLAFIALFAFLALLALLALFALITFIALVAFVTRDLAEILGGSVGIGDDEFAFIVDRCGGNALCVTRTAGETEYKRKRTAKHTNDDQKSFQNRFVLHFVLLIF